MRILLLTLMSAALFAVPALSQTQFPGVSAEQAKKLAEVKRTMAFPLPKWVPAGFKIEKIVAKTGSRTKIEDRVFTVVYSREVAGGKAQRFSIDAGFDGLGDLMFDATKTLKTPVGSVILIYQPIDEDGKKVLNYAMTEWFTVGKYAFHYDGAYDADENGAAFSMISLADTEKILKSLTRY